MQTIFLSIYNRDLRNEMLRMKIVVVN